MPIENSVAPVTMPVNSQKSPRSKPRTPRSMMYHDPFPTNKQASASPMKPTKQTKNLTARLPGVAARNMANMVPNSMHSRSMPATTRMVGMSMPRSRYVNVMNGAQALKISSASMSAAKNLPATMECDLSVEM